MAAVELRRGAGRRAARAVLCVLLGLTAGAGRAVANEWVPMEKGDPSEVYYWYDESSIRYDPGRDVVSYLYAHSRGGHPRDAGLYFGVYAEANCSSRTKRSRDWSEDTWNPSDPPRVFGDDSFDARLCANRHSLRR